MTAETSPEPNYCDKIKINVTREIDNIEYYRELKRIIEKRPAAIDNTHIYSYNQVQQTVLYKYYLKENY